jgi:hypothetical protein
MRGKAAHVVSPEPRSSQKNSPTPTASPTQAERNLCLASPFEISPLLLDLDLNGGRGIVDGSRSPSARGVAPPDRASRELRLLRGGAIIDAKSNA